MTEGIIIALIGFLGTIIGSAIGVIASSKLINYRLEQLEQKVNKHNNLIERTYELERKESIVEEHIENIESEIHELKEHHR
jgi:ABC-type lipoprotein release transport system permease subunit